MPKRCHFHKNCAILCKKRKIEIGYEAVKFDERKGFVFVFTVVYFLIFCFFIDLIFRNTLNILSDLLAIACWAIAFIISVALAEYTVKKFLR